MTDELNTEVPAPKKKGWPKGKPRGPRKAAVDREPVHAAVHDPKFQYVDDDDDDRLKVPKEMIPSGMDYQWVTDSVLGQPMPQRRARFERKGWMPVPSERHDGVFMPRGYKGEINVDGLVLMERPLEYSLRAREKDRLRAREQVYVREAQLRGGDLGSNIAFDTQHQSALRTNKLVKSYEPVKVPRED